MARTKEETRQYHREYWLKHRDQIISEKREPRRAGAIAYAKEYREKHRDLINTKKRKYASREEIKVKRREYDLKNKEAIKATKAEWNRKTWPYRKEKSERTHREWYANTDWYRHRHKERWETDHAYRMKLILRNRIRDAVHGEYRSGVAIKLLGCTIPELRAHIEGQFQPGMTWDNWSLHGWHIDHRRALASFDMSSPEQVSMACHYSNLQPMWAADNIRKGSK